MPINIKMPLIAKVNLMLTTPQTFRASLSFSFDETNAI